MSPAVEKAASKDFQRFVVKNTKPNKVRVKSVTTPSRFHNPHSVDFVLDIEYVPYDEADGWPWSFSDRFCIQPMFDVEQSAVH